MTYLQPFRLVSELSVLLSFTSSSLSVVWLYRNTKNQELLQVISVAPNIHIQAHSPPARVPLRSTMYLWGN